MKVYAKWIDGPERIHYTIKHPKTIVITETIES